MQKLKDLFTLFITFFKIGAFTFGGGLAMVPLIAKEIVEKKKWMTDEEMVDMIAIAESTPGVIAVNCATFVGYRTKKILGAIMATLGVCLPSLIIIIIISLFYEKFMEIEVIKWAFFGIKCAVAILILNAGIKLLKNVKKNVYSYIVLLVALLLSLFVKEIKTVYIILSGLILGIIFYSICYAITEKKKNKISNDEASIEELSDDNANQTIEKGENND